MALVPNLSGSVNAIKNENNAALVSFNLDISLFRREPPVEFLPVGSALSHRRREEAEVGPQHKLACRLGFLFNDIIPDTPKLIRAYGTRVSEILTHPDINPRGSEKDGPFRDFVGADGTSIWAAATSLPASISLHLLACLLARAWNARQAIAIWIELIAERKRQIQDRLDQHRILNPNTHLALQQEFNRDDISKWVASVRSWSQRADEYMVSKKTQLSLITDNIGLLPFADRGTTYEKITTAWFRSMEVLEALLGNEQRVANDQATLVAISAWHLYPDLLVFQEETKKVSFNDPLLPGSAILSLGLEYRDTSHQTYERKTDSNRWSLALSHLKYYGAPVTVRNPGTERATVDELWLVCLGMILGHWEVPISKLDVSVQWFERLGSIMQVKKVHQDTDCSSMSWLLNLCRVAPYAASADKMVLVKFGHRRALKESTSMLGHGVEPLRPPFFGLCCSHVIESAKQRNDREIGFKYLRLVANQLQLSTDDAFILRNRKESEGAWSEWATIAPVPLRLIDPNSLTSDPDASDLMVNARWMYFEDHTGITEPLHRILESERLERKEAGEFCELVWESNAIPQKRMNQQHQVNSTPADVSHDRSSHYFWPPNAPPFFARMGSAVRFIPLRTMAHSAGQGLYLLVRDTHYSRVKELQSRMARDAMKFDVHYGLHWLHSEESLQHVFPFLRYFFQANTKHSAPRNSARVLGTKKRRLDDLFPDMTDDYTTFPEKRAVEVSHLCYYTVYPYRRIPLEWVRSMRALEIITILYQQFPYATIPMQIIKLDLSKANWLPGCIRSKTSYVELSSVSIQEACGEMDRAHSFACIAMLESGEANFDPHHTESVVALSSENTIFVAGILLSDPTIENQGMSMRHLVGNIGQSGIVLMVAPMEPTIRALGYSASLVDHQLYDGKHLDKFKGTSLHLSFTEWKMPVFWESNGDIDQQIFLLESVISVQDKGRWVADLDILCLEREKMDVLVGFDCDCNIEEAPAEEDIASLDSWDELLDAPPSVGVVRASGNWVARLSIASVLVQKGNSHCAVIVAHDSRGICWKHLTESYEYPEPHMPRFIVI